jgi:Ser/Thr protein kinase RdoA (MazF antagonist)
MGWDLRRKLTKLDARIKQRYSPAILEKVAGCYRITADRLTLLDGFESFIYSFEEQGKGYILRVAHSLRRSEAMILGEADWINFLALGGVNVAKVIPSRNGRLVETVGDGFGGEFLATVFDRAPGKPAWEVGWRYSLYQNLGQMIGRMHTLTKPYHPSDPRAFRPQWDDPIILMDEAWLPDEEEISREKYRKIVDWCQTIPKHKDDYGLIHFDAHAGNYFIDQRGQIHLFDFDDCHYSWFSNDIAIVLFYMVMGTEDTAAFTINFMRQFILGYQRENQFKAGWLPQIPMFLKMREIDLYGVIHRSCDVDHLSDEWDIRYMKNRKEKIEDDVPYIDLDFSSLAELL